MGPSGENTALWDEEESPHSGARPSYTGTASQMQKEVFSAALSKLCQRRLPSSLHTPTDSLLTPPPLRLGAQDSAFQNPTGAERVGDHSASRSGECYQIQMSGTRRKWSPPARKQLGWAQNMHRNQNGHKRWEAPQVESIIVAETEIRKGTYTVRHSLLGKDIPKQKQDESHAFLSTTGSHIHYWKYSWKYLSRGITTRNLFFF